MFMKSLSIITLGAFVAMTAGPSIAADFDRYSLSHFNPYDHYGQTRGTIVGAYLRIPLSGRQSRSASEPRFGLTLSVRRPGQYGYTRGFASSDAPKLLDLSIGLSGQKTLKDSFRFNGMSIANMEALYADETRKDNKAWPIIVAVGVVAGVALTVAAGEQIKKDLDKALDCLPFGFCPEE